MMRERVEGVSRKYRTVKMSVHINSDVGGACCVSPVVDFIHRWDDRHQVRCGTREVKRRILQDLVKASLSLLLFMLVSGLTFSD